MLRILLLTLFLLFTAQLTTFAQVKEKPKAYLFDEFGATNVKEIKTRTQKLKEKLEELAQKGITFTVYLVFSYDEKNKSSGNFDILVAQILNDKCRDCFGLYPRIIFVNFKKFKEQKIQFWIMSEGAEPPEFLNPNKNK